MKIDWSKTLEIDYLLNGLAALLIFFLSLILLFVVVYVWVDFFRDHIRKRRVIK